MEKKIKKVIELTQSEINALKEMLYQEMYSYETDELMERDKYYFAMKSIKEKIEKK